MAAPTLVGTSAWTNGAQNPQPTYPSGLQEGDVVYLIAVSRPSTISINILSGWEFVGDATGGGGTEGSGTGPTRVSVLKRSVGSSGLSGALPSGLFTGTNAAVAHLRAYRGPSAAAVFDETFTSYSNSSASTTVGGTGGASLSLATDDIVLGIIAGPDDTVTSYSVSNLTASGATFGSLSESPSGTFSTATGNDLSMACVTRTVTAGSSSSAPVVTATADASETSMGFLLRVRASGSVSGAVSRSTTASATATAFVAAPAAVSRQTTASVVATARVVSGANHATTAAVTVTAKLEPGGSAETVAAVVATAQKTDPISAAATTFAVGSATAYRTGHPDATHATTAQVEATAFLLVGVENQVTTAHAVVTATERRPDFGTIHIGRLTLTEHYAAVSEAWSGDGRTLSLSGQESAPPLTEQDIDVLLDDLQNLQGMLVPVSFTWKQDRDGYYTVTGVTSDLVNWGDIAHTVDWKLTLRREGADGEVDIESRLSGPPTRSNTHNGTGERWHAPPIGTTSYWTGTTQPSTLTRPTTDGPITIYRGIPTTANPRYDVPAASYMRGRARILDQGRERNGVQWRTTPGGWELSNGLVKASLVTVEGGSTALMPGPRTFPGKFVYPGSGVSGTVLRLEAWGLTPIFIPGGGYGISPYGVADYGEAYGTEDWSGRDWTILLNGQAIGAPAACSVLRNDPECVSVRVLWSGAPAGRTTADMTLRRGGRLLEMFLRTSFSSTLKVVRAIPEAATAQAGYLRATADDTNGNRYFIGSAGDYTADVIGGGISKASTTSLDVALGVEMSGADAAQGDQAATLYKQYCGSCTEMVSAARR